MTAAFLVASAFLASAVEFVEALTIVLAVGVTRGWRSTMTGVAAASAVLAGVVVALGPALTVIPIRGLRVVVGGLLLVFGLQWLRKAILRSSGDKALHDEDEAFRQEREQPASSSIPTLAQRQGILGVDVRNPLTGAIYPAGTPIPVSRLTCAVSHASASVRFMD